MIGQPLPAIFASALCRQVDPDLWFSPSKADRAKAIAICRRCPAIRACGELGRDEVWGVWGGKAAGGPRNRDFVLERQLRLDADRDQTVTFTAPETGAEQAS